MSAHEFIPYYLRLLALAVLAAVFLVDWRRRKAWSILLVVGCVGLGVGGALMVGVQELEESRAEIEAMGRAAALEQSRLEFLGQYLGERHRGGKVVVIVGESSDPNPTVLAGLGRELETASGNSIQVMGVHHPQDFARLAGSTRYPDMMCDEEAYAACRDSLLKQYGKLDVLLDLSQAGASVQPGGGGGKQPRAQVYKVVLGVTPTWSGQPTPTPPSEVEGYLEMKAAPSTIAAGGMPVWRMVDCSQMASKGTAGQ